MRPLRLGLSACGRLAEAGYLPALEGVPGFALAGVADPDPGRRDLLGAASSAASYASTQELLDEAAVDALLVAGPAASHLHDAMLASAAGVSALVEKPPAATVAEAQEMAALERPPWIAFNRRFSPLAGIRGELPRGGRVDLDLEIRYRRAAWRPVSVQDDAIADLAPHLVDLALWLTGAEPSQVAEAQLAPERATLALETSRGMARIACALDRAHLERVAGAGTERVIGGPVANLLARVRRDEAMLVISLREQLRAFEAVARGGENGDLGTALDGLRAMQVIEAARRCASSGEPAEIETRQASGVAA